MRRFLLLIVFLEIGTVLPQDFVCLKVNAVKEIIFLKCRIDRIVHDVEFFTPKGSLYGSCPAPVPPQLIAKLPIDCGNNITQYLERNITILRLDNSDEWLGVWTCKHGSARSNDSVNITRCLLDRDVQLDSITVTGVGVDGWFRTGLFLSIYIISLLAVAILSHIQPVRTFVDLLKGYCCRLKSNWDSERVPLLEQDISLQGKCSMCDRHTSFAFCDCKKFFCELCSHVHNHKEKNHLMVQIQHEFENHEKKLQSTCRHISPQRVCEQCLHVYCGECSCKHERHLTKPIIISTSSKRKLRFEEKRRIEKPKVKFELKLPDKNPDITGLACLSGGFVAAIDYKNWTLHLFLQSRTISNYNLKMEPKALTKVHKGKIAISFAYEKLIRVFAVHVDKAVELFTEKISLENVGKPFNISYSNNFYAVEIGERRFGFIAIINADGEVIKKILNNKYSFGYFTSNNLRLALDMNKRLLYTSAIGKESIYCVDFDGSIRWHAQIPSPREIHLVPADRGITHILIASNTTDLIYQVIGKDADLNKRTLKASVLEFEGVQKPDYISYDIEDKLLSVGMDSGKINVFDIDIGKTGIDVMI